MCGSRGPRRGARHRERGRQGGVLKSGSMPPYVLPALGLLVVGVAAGPLVWGILVSAVGVAVVIAAAAAALSVSAFALPFLVGLFGLPALLVGGLAAGKCCGCPMQRLHRCRR